MEISIRVPVNGTIDIFFGCLRVNHYFNPRTREGHDTYCLLQDGRCYYFNPRTREGCDFTPLA